MRKFFRRKTVLLGLIAILLSSMTTISLVAQEEPYPELPFFQQIRCDVPIPDGVRVTCGNLIVPSDRRLEASTPYGIAVTILHSTSPDPEPDPVVSLTGGPGGITTPYLPYAFRQNYYGFLQKRDFIMFDQRGVGRSKPSLDCPNVLQAGYVNAGEWMSLAERNALDVAETLACLDVGVANGVDVSVFTTLENAADLEDLRIALGYDEWNLFGVSYGTKLALTAMRDFPEGLRSVILDSTYPLQSDLYAGIAANQQRAFDLLFATCAANDACNTAYPDLEATFYALVQQLNEAPVQVAGTHTSQRFNFQAWVDGYSFADWVFQKLYDKYSIPHLPSIVWTVAQGDIDPLFYVAQDILDRPAGVSEGMYYSVQCGEEFGFVDPEEALLAAGNLHPVLLPMHEAFIQGSMEICTAWGARTPDERENAPVVSDVPTLILAGEFDPITPPAWGAMVAEDLTNSYFYTFPGVGHGAIRTEECAMQIALAFVDDPLAEPDATCIEAIPPVEFDLG